MSNLYSIMLNIGQIQSLFLLILGLLIGVILIFKSLKIINGKIINNPECKLIFNDMYSCKNVKIKYKLYDNDFVEILKLNTSKRLKKGDFFVYKKFDYIRQLLFYFGTTVILFAIFFYLLTKNELGNMTAAINLVLYALILLII